MAARETMLDETRWFEEDLFDGEAEDACHERGAMLEISVFWRDHLLSVQAWEKPRTLTVGDDPSCDFILEEGRWPAARFPLLTQHDNRWHLTLFHGLDALLVGRDHRVDIKTILKRKHLTPHPEWKGAWMLELVEPGEDRPEEEEVFLGATITAGEVRYVIRLIDREERVGPLGPVDATPIPFISASALLHTLLLALALTVPPGIPHLDRETLPPSQERFIKAIVVPPRVVLPERPRGQDLQGDGEDEVLSQRHSQEEGLAGARDAEESSRGRIAHKKNEDHDEAPRAAKARELKAVNGVEGAGVLSLLDGIADIAGEAETSSGEEAIDAMGHLASEELGEAKGEEGLGTSGSGRGAGSARGESIGLSHAMGMRRSGMGGRGVAPRLARRAAEIDDIYFKREADSSKGQQGCLTRAMVKRAIDRRRNQIRACYEAELLRDRDLEGSVQVRLTIGQDGKVSDFHVTRNTTRQDAIPRCLEHKLKDLRFPAFEKCEQVVINHPFNFHPKQLLVLPSM